MIKIVYFLRERERERETERESERESERERERESILLYHMSVLLDFLCNLHTCVKNAFM